MPKQKRLTGKEYIRAIFSVASLSYRIAPSAIGFKLVGVVINASLPVVTTFFAAVTTTQLAAAYGGDAAAGAAALWYVVLTALLGLASTVWNSVDQYVQQLVRYRVEAKVSDAMYEHFLSLDFWQYDDKNTADLYDKAQKFSQFYAYVFDRVGGILTQFISMLAALVALFLVLPVVGMLALVAVVPGVFLQFKLSRMQIAHWNKNVDVRRARSFIEWNLLQPKAIAELRLNGLVRHLLDLRRSYRDRDEKQRLGYERDYIAKRLWADALEAAVELGSLVWVVLQIIARQQPLGQFVYVQQLVSRAIGGANSFVGQISTIDEDLANLYDYQEFMQLPARQNGEVALQNVPGAIVFSDVSFRYPNAKNDVLKNVSFSITKGTHVAIVGENGAGKSTLIKLLTGLYAPSQGAILLDDVSLQNITIDSWHKKLGVLQQDFAQYSFTDVKNNVYFGDVSQPVSGARVDQALKDAEAYDFVAKLPKGQKSYPSTWMEDEEGTKGVNLSGGQWQRLALARSFYRSAPIIILDEPTSAIDALAEARIFKRLFAKNNDKTVITISHRLSTVEKADVIIMLDDGAVVETGTHAELVKKRGRYYAMFESQIRQ